MSVNRRLQHKFLLVMLLAGMLLMRSPAPIARAASLTVNALLDNTVAGDGFCTLREAITAANDNANYHDCTAAGYGADTITFGVTGTITLKSQLPAVTDGAGLTISGPPGGITISGNSAVRVLAVATGGMLSLENLTVANGGGGSGAGVDNLGTLNLAHCTFSGNNNPSTIMGTGGGAIRNDGTVTAANCTFSNNTSTDTVGGAIFSRNGVLTVSNCTFFGNRAGDGGAILNNANATVTGSTFTDNSATAIGGSISNSASGTATVANSTFSGNNATTNGGGIYNNGTVAVTNCTFSGNSQASLYRNMGTVTVYNTILANGTTGRNCDGTITNGGNNMDDGTTCGWGSSNGSMSNTNPSLGALADNGGPTQTMALLAGSPAIDGVVFNAPNGCPATDQRGVARPIGPRCDIGAYEADFLICLPFMAEHSP